MSAIRHKESKIVFSPKCKDDDMNKFTNISRRNFTKSAIATSAIAGMLTPSRPIRFPISPVSYQLFVF